jgi:hypothetical protein
MKKALQEAEMAFDKGEIPVGAIVVVNNVVIARSHNLTELLNVSLLMLKCRQLPLRQIILEVNI